MAFLNSAWINMDGFTYILSKGFSRPRKQVTQLESFGQSGIGNVVQEDRIRSLCLCLQGERCDSGAY